MSTSQNGWICGSREAAGVTTLTVPGTGIRLPVNAAAGPLLIWAARQWHTRVEPLHEGWCWGWADRKIRGGSTQNSNHASGTAIDLNAPEHPRGVPARDTLSARQIAEIHQILGEANKVDWVLRWGGDYTHPSEPDAMHIEVVGTPAQVRDAHRRLTAPPRPPPIKELLEMELNDLITIPARYPSNKDRRAGIPEAKAKDERITVATYLARTYDWQYQILDRGAS